MSRSLRVHVQTLGCDKNLVDSENLLGIFAGHGVEAVGDPEDADIWVLNTCGFIEAARRDSYAAIESLIAEKAHRRLVVTGCLSQEHGDEIRSRYPEIDLIGGVGNFSTLVESLELEMERSPLVLPDAAVYENLGTRPLLTPPHLAFIKLGEGCNLRCGFCRIPLIRGNLRSRTIAEIGEEARTLVGRGVGEINLISQNTSDYGKDNRETLIDLLRELSAIDDLRWLRLFYFFPGRHTIPEFRSILEIPKVVPYLDMPMQHASPTILKAMRRPPDSRGAAEAFKALRRDNPDLVLRTTVLLGYPGETEDDVEMLADFLADVQFDHLGTYRYSPEEGTAGAELDNEVDPEEIVDREARILDLQLEISQSRQQTRLDRRTLVVVDAIEDAEDWLDTLDELAPQVHGLSIGDRVAVARSAALGFEADGVILMPAADLEPGDWLDARIVAVTPFDSLARDDR